MAAARAGRCVPYRPSVTSAVRRVYALSPAAALAMTAALAAAFAGLLVAYRGLLFFTTYYTL